MEDLELTPYEGFTNNFTFETDHLKIIPFSSSLLQIPQFQI